MVPLAGHLEASPINRLSTAWDNFPPTGFRGIPRAIVPPDESPGHKRKGPESLAGDHGAKIDKKSLPPKPTAIMADLQELARDVRRIGSGFRCDPEAIAMAKDEIAHRLTGLARRIGGAA